MKIQQNLIIALIMLIICSCSQSTENPSLENEDIDFEEIVDNDDIEEETNEMGTLLWDYEAVTDIRSTIAILDNLIFFSGTGSNLYALNITTGDLVWKTPLGFSRFGSGPIINNQTIYVGTTEGTFAVNANTGEIIWEAEVTTDGRVWVNNEKVYVSSWNGIHALDASNGNLLWHFMVDGTIFEPSFYGGVTVTNNKVYAGSTSGLFYCLEAENGNELWQFDAEDAILNSPISKGDLIIFGSGDTWGLNLNTGIEVWKNNNSLSNEPFETENKIFYTSALTLYCVDAIDGETIWSKHAFGQRDYHPFTAFKEKLYTSISGGQGIYTFDIQTGGDPKLVYSVPTTDTFGGIFSKPIIKDSVIYFGSTNNKLYAVKLP